jgi:UDP-N-acetylmuramate--alanine ligase
MRVYFIGIGGIGVSALAKYYLKKGWQVSGSDLASSEIIEALKKEGAKIKIGKHKAGNLPKNIDLVIYSPAVQKDNPELKKAYKLRATSYELRIMSYPQALGELTKKHFTIAVAGTHGKSTTTAMVGLLLVKAGFDPTLIVGTKLKEFKDSNCRVGKSRYLVIEADEHFASFLNYWPKIIVLTRIEADHLDYFKNFKNYITAFRKFVSRLPKDGLLVANKDDRNIQRILNSKLKIKKTRGRTSGYSLKQPEAKKMRKVLKIPGEHNVSNALAALAVARVLKIPDKISFKALSEYKGSWRRFEEKSIKLNAKRLTLISDYGHHPTEIKATLEAAREKYSKKQIWLVYQPHQYQRTYYLFNDFVKVFRKIPADKAIITDIFDVVGREDKKIKKRINAKILVEKIDRPDVIYLGKEKIVEYLKKNLRGREVVIIMGAGDVYKLYQQF